TSPNGGGASIPRSSSARARSPQFCATTASRCSMSRASSSPLEKHVKKSRLNIQSANFHLAFPAKAGTHCVPRMTLNLEVQVLFGPRGAEPIANGNCVVVIRGGEEAGGKSGSRRTDIGYKASAVGQPGNGRGRPILLLSRARVDPAVTPRKCNVLPWEISPAVRANRSRVPATASEGRGGVSRGHSSADPRGRREGLN